VATNQGKQSCLQLGKNRQSLTSVLGDDAYVYKNDYQRKNDGGGRVVSGIGLNMKVRYSKIMPTSALPLGQIYGWQRHAPRSKFLRLYGNSHAKCGRQAYTSMPAHATMQKLTCTRNECVSRWKILLQSSRRPRGRSLWLAQWASRTSRPHRPLGKI
jgi:hypothetical protein